MPAIREPFRSGVTVQVRDLLDAISTAEAAIVTTIERECEALRNGHFLAAKAFRIRLGDVTRSYLDAIRAARANLPAMELVLPGCRDLLEERRAAFSSVLKVELAILAAEQAAASERWGERSADFRPGGAALSASGPQRLRHRRRRPQMPRLRASGQSAA